MQFVYAGNRYDVTGTRLFNLVSFKTVEAQHLHDFAGTLCAITAYNLDLLVGCHAASFDSRNPDDANITAVIERRDLHLQWTFKIHVRWINVFENGFY